MKRGGHLLFVVGTVVLVSLMYGGVASATDDKILPGFACNVVNGATVQYLVNAGSVGAVGNSSYSSSLMVYCPILRDSLYDDDPTDFDIWVKDSTTASSIACTFSASGAFGDWSTAHEDGGVSGEYASNTGLMEIDIDPPAMSTGLETRYVLYCSIPVVQSAASLIYGYRIYEE